MIKDDLLNYISPSILWVLLSNFESWKNQNLVWYLNVWASYVTNKEMSTSIYYSPKKIRWKKDKVCKTSLTLSFSFSQWGSKGSSLKNCYKWLHLSKKFWKCEEIGEFARLRNWSINSALTFFKSQSVEEWLRQEQSVSEVWKDPL